jgi:hypothetical protein
MQNADYGCVLEPTTPLRSPVGYEREFASRGLPFGRHSVCGASGSAAMTETNNPPPVGSVAPLGELHRRSRFSFLPPTWTHLIEDPLHTTPANDNVPGHYIYCSATASTSSLARVPNGVVQPPQCHRPGAMGATIWTRTTGRA